MRRWIMRLVLSCAASPFLIMTTLMTAAVAEVGPREVLLGTSTSRVVSRADTDADAQAFYDAATEARVRLRLHQDPVVLARDVLRGATLVRVRPVVDDDDESVLRDRSRFPLDRHQVALQKPGRGVVDHDHGKPSVHD